MKVTGEKVGEVTVVIIDADHLDAGNVNDFKRDVTAFNTPNVKVVLDLGKVQFVDSSGCGSILSFLRQVKATGGDIKLCAITKPVRALFELVRMHRVFEIFNTREEAIKAYQV